MKELKTLTIKYVVIIIVLQILKAIIITLYPEIYSDIEEIDNVTRTSTSLWGHFNEHVFNIVLALFAFWDLKRYGIKTIIIPVLIIISSYLGLFLAALLLINKKLDNEFI